MKGTINTKKFFRIAYTKFQKMEENNIFYVTLLSDEEIKALDTEDRWTLHPTHNKENISQHSFWVTFFTWILCKKQGYDAAKTGMALAYGEFHDFDEIFTGDLNHKFKYDTDNGIDREQVKEYGKRKTIEKLKQFGISEKDIMDTLDVPEEIKTLVKLADWFSAMQYLTFELGMGNRMTKIQNDFLYCLMGLCKAIEDFSATKKEGEVDADLAALFLELTGINNKLYEQ